MLKHFFKIVVILKRTLQNYNKLEENALLYFILNVSVGRHMNNLILFKILKDSLISLENLFNSLSCGKSRYCYGNSL